MICSDFVVVLSWCSYTLIDVGRDYLRAAERTSVYCVTVVENTYDHILDISEISGFFTA